MFSNWLTIPIVIIIGIITKTNGLSLGRIYVSELFSTKIEPKLFNWTFTQTEHFKYRCSLKGYPDLPSWLHYMYSNEYHAGYLYGTPPENLSGYEVNLDVIGLNKLTYETGHIILSLFITRRNFNPKNSIHMKIDNLNWVNFMDPGRVENLKNIYRQDLWPESNADLHIIFMESAIKMGGRVPLRPQQKEGVIVHLGSSAEFSQKLKDLQNEIKPLYKIATCSYKRTSVQTVFESAGFKMDWCAFRIVGNDILSVASSAGHGDSSVQSSTVHKSMRMGMGDVERQQWEPMMAKSDVPQRNYIDELAICIAIPGVLFAFLIGILSAVLCFHHEKIINTKTMKPIVQMVQYSNANNQPTTTTLKSLKDPNLLLAYDNLSVNSTQSQCNTNNNNNNNGINQMGDAGGDCSPPASSTLRPRPPPYNKPSIVYRNRVEI